MKTFETEFNELKKWLLNRTKEWQMKTNGYKNAGHDCEDDNIQHEYILEYNRRLSDLKKKYSKETTAQNTISHKERERIQL